VHVYCVGVYAYLTTASLAAEEETLVGRPSSKCTTMEEGVY